MSPTRLAAGIIPLLFFASVGSAQDRPGTRPAAARTTIGAVLLYLDVGEARAHQLEYPRLKLALVVPNGPTDKACLETGDVLLQVDGQDVRDEAKLLAISQARQPGDAIEFLVLRGSERVRKTVILEPTPPDADWVQSLRPLAEKDNAVAWLNLAAAYFSGQGIARDLDKGLKCVRKAADLGLSEAQGLLGDWFCSVPGPTRDETEGLRWLGESAKNGNVKAILRVAQHCMFKKRDPAEALRWLQPAAEVGAADAEAMVGLVMRNVPGPTHNDVQAALWLKKAADKDHAEAQYTLSIMLARGEGVARNSQEALRLLARAADLGLGEAQTNLGMAYIYGTGVPKDAEVGADWLRKSALQGDPIALNVLGQMVLDGTGVPRDQEQGIRWLKAAARRGNADAAKRLQALGVKP